MAKRFTDSDKWQDKWFRRLPPDQKLAYLYILDRCDMAGTIEIDTELAEFQMGCSTDWEELVKGSDTRLVPLANGRLWVRKFIAYQNGKLSGECNAHKPILRLVERYELPNDCDSDTVPNENKGKRTKGTGTHKVPLAKGTGNSNGKGNGNTKGECEGEWIIPPNLDTPEVRKGLADFAAMRRTIKKPIRNFANTSRILSKFESTDHLLHAIDLCIANEWQGLNPDYRPDAKAGSKYKPPGERKKDPKLEFELRRSVLVKRARDEDWDEERLRDAIDRIKPKELSTA